MNRATYKSLRAALDSESISYGELAEIESVFETIPDAKLCDRRENATAGDMLDEIERLVLNPEIVDMYDVQRAHRGHWFDPDTLRFFRGRVATIAYETVDGRYRFFVSSEQFEGSNRVRAPRLYTVRVQTVATGEIDTVGDFQAYGSRKRADTDARRFATDPAGACSLLTSDTRGSCPVHDEWHNRPDAYNVNVSAETMTGVHTS